MVGIRAAIVADIIITIGERAKIIAETALLSGKEVNTIMSFNNSDDALNYLRENLRTSDVVLVKGSRAMNMEKIVPSLEMES